jgi:hypothetical protein
MKKVAIFLFLVFVLFAGVLILLFYYYFVQTRPFRNPDKPNFDVSQANIVNLKTDSQLTDILGNPVPLSLHYDELEGIIVSGVIQEQKIETDGSLLIAIPDSNDTLKRSILVWTYIGGADKSILLLKLPNGKFAGVENWNLNNNFPELASLLQPGKQIIVHIEESDQGKAEKLIQEAKSSYFTELAPITRIIIGI